MANNRETQIRMIDALNAVLHDPNAHYDEQSRALHQLEKIAGVRVTGPVRLGEPLRPEELPEMPLDKVPCLNGHR